MRLRSGLMEDQVSSAISDVFISNKCLQAAVPWRAFSKRMEDLFGVGGSTRQLSIHILGVSTISHCVPSRARIADKRFLVNLTNVLWVEQPVGTGFSIGEVTATSEEDIAKDLYVVHWQPSTFKTLSMSNIILC